MKAHRVVDHYSSSSRLDSARTLLCAALATSLVACAWGGSPTAPAPLSAPAPQPSSETLPSAGYNALLKVVVATDCTPAELLEPTVPLHYLDGWLAWFGLCEPMLPLRTPDERQLGAGEWVHASGQLTVSCDGSGTRYDFQLQNLVPGGTYALRGGPTGGGGLPSDASTTFSATTAGAAVLSIRGNPGAAVAPACGLPVPAEPPISIHYIEPRQNDLVGHLVFRKP